MAQFPLFFGSDVFRGSVYGPRHPLSIQRIPLLTDFCRASGWLDTSNYVECSAASYEELARYHDRAYIKALQEAEANQNVPADVRDRHNLGKLESPIYPEMFRRPATACGASLMAARHLLRNGGTIYNPLGGTHHGRRDRASGFCFFNDPVLALMELLDGGLERVAYIDIDAHHADGVEEGIGHDRRVLCISVHEAGRWPFTGLAGETAGGSVRNFPVPPGMNDSELEFILDEAIEPMVRAFRPEALVLQCGCDALADDPLSKQELSNNAYWRFVSRFLPISPRLLVLGGGGYNPWAVVRCWSGIWASLNRWAVPNSPADKAGSVLRSIAWNRSQGRNPPEHWFDTIRDRPNDGEVREQVKAVVHEVMAHGVVQVI